MNNNNQQERTKYKTTITIKEENGMSNLANKKLTTKKLIKGLALASLAMGGGVLFAEIAWAKFDIDAGVAAATNPIIKGIEDHWGKGVIMSGAAAALFGEGDGRQRAIRAGVAAGSAGAVVLGLMAMLK
jgi:hypothetical protein